MKTYIKSAFRDQHSAIVWAFILITQWHGASNPGQMFHGNTINGDRDKLLVPVLFVDGHGQECDFTAVMTKNLMRGLEPVTDWMWYKPIK